MRAKFKIWLETKEQELIREINRGESGGRRIGDCAVLPDEFEAECYRRENP